jgi:1-acyl-sn-glycerol-3-phosphate acyltransferase
MSGCVAPEGTPARADQEIGRGNRKVGPMRILGRVIALVVAVVLGLALIAAVTGLPGHRRGRRGTWALQHVSRWILVAIGVHLVVDGVPRSGPSLVVGNHVSWLDVLALSASAPMRMVANAEIRQWPIVGRPSVRSGTLFVHPDRLRELPGVVADIAAALRSGSRVQVFPEGTTQCGSALDPFRRAAFQAAIDAGVVVSPVTVRYVDAQRRRMPAPGFLGQETLARSVQRIVTLSGLSVRVRWLPPIPAIAGTGHDYIDRARVARLAENAVARDLRIPVLRNVTGPLPEPAFPPRAAVKHVAA